MDPALDRIILAEGEGDVGFPLEHDSSVAAARPMRAFSSISSLPLEPLIWNDRSTVMFMFFTESFQSWAAVEVAMR